jgi:hypothetical protein
MNPRLLILLALAVVLAVVLAKKVTSPPPPEGDGREVIDNQNKNGIDPPDPTQELLWTRYLAGEEPPEEPELSIRVEVNTSSGKNQLDFYISEAHGYYVETFQIDFYWKEHPDMEADESPLTVPHYLDDYVKANETVKDCIQVVPAELSRVGGDIGTTENWGVRIASHGRARAQNPDPLPAVAVRRCD